MKLSLNRRLAVRDAVNSTFEKQRPARPAKKIGRSVSLPVFTSNPFPWLGSSFIITEFWGNLPNDFYFRKPIVAPNFTFVLAVRWPQRNDTGLDVTRYKFWTAGDNVVYPLYTGQTINKDFALEVWTTPAFSQVEFASLFSLITSILSDPVSCCDNTPVPFTLTEVCELFDLPDPTEYDLPLTFDTCFDDIVTDTFRRKIETDELRAIETGENRLYA